MLYDSERGMYYYGKNLSEAVEKNYEDRPFSEKTNQGVIFNLKVNAQLQHIKYHTIKGENYGKIN